MDHAARAHELLAAADGAYQVAALGLSPEDGTRVQHELMRLRLAQGHTVAGLKLGLTNPVARESFAASEPVLCDLLSAFRIADELPLAGLIAPSAEPEIAFVLARDLGGPEVTRDDVVAATASVHPALEIVDRRTSGSPSLGDLVADAVFACRYALGPGSAPDALDLLAVAMTIEVDGEAAGSGVGANALGDPAWAVAWGARRRPLRAGEVVLSGTLCAPPALVGHERVAATFTGLGSVALRLC